MQDHHPDGRLQCLMADGASSSSGSSSNSTSLQPHAFISHAGTNADFPTAELLKLCVEGRNADVRMDYNSTPPGEAWRDSLRELSRTSQVFIAVVSTEYLTRRWCMLELCECLRARAAGASITLIPLLLDISSRDLGKAEIWLSDWRELQDDPRARQGTQLSADQLQQACRELSD